MDDQNNRDNEMSKIVEKAENLKTMLAKQKSGGAEAPAEPEEKSPAAPVGNPDLKAAHMPFQHTRTVAEKRRAIDAQFESAIADSKKSVGQLIDEAVEAKVQAARQALADEKQAFEAQIRAEADAKVADAKRAQADAESALEDQKAQAEAAAEDFKAQLAQKDGVIADAQREKAEIAAQVEAQKTEKEALRSQIEEARQSAADYDDELTQLRRAIAERDTKVADITAERDDALRAADGAKQQLSDYQKQVEAAQAEPASDSTTDVGLTAQPEAEKIATENETEPAPTDDDIKAFFAMDGGEAADGNDAQATSIWDEGDEDDLFESEETAEDDGLFESEEAVEEDKSAEDFVVSHAAYRTNPKEDVELSEDIPWVSPNTAEEMKKRRKARAELMQQAAAREAQAAEAARSAEAKAKPVGSRQAEEEHDVLDVLRNAGAEPEAPQAEAADTAQDVQAEDAVENLDIGALTEDEAQFFEQVGRETAEETDEAELFETEEPLNDDEGGLFEDVETYDQDEQAAQPEQDESQNGSIFDDVTNLDDADQGDVFENSKGWSDLQKEEAEPEAPAEAADDFGSLFEEDETDLFEDETSSEAPEAEPAEEAEGAAPAEPASAEAQLEDFDSLFADDGGDDLFEEDEPVEDAQFEEEPVDAAPAEPEPEAEPETETAPAEAEAKPELTQDEIEEKARIAAKNAEIDKDIARLGDTQVLDTGAINDFFEMAEKDDDVPSLFDNPSTDDSGDDLFEDETTIEEGDDVTQIVSPSEIEEKLDAGDDGSPKPYHDDFDDLFDEGDQDPFGDDSGSDEDSHADKKRKRGLFRRNR